MKVVMTEREKVYFQKLPKELRTRIAQALGQPELVPPDGRTAKAEARRAAKAYRVQYEGERGSHECTLPQAAAMVGWNVEALERELTKPARGYGRRGVEVTTPAGVVCVTKVTTS